MREQELGTCDFCKNKKFKPVLRKYIHAKNKRKSGDGFVIIRYCSECGVDEVANLGLATTRVLLDEVKARIEIDGKLEYRTVDCGNPTI